MKYALIAPSLLSLLLGCTPKEGEAPATAPTAIAVPEETAAKEEVAPPVELAKEEITEEEAKEVAAASNFVLSGTLNLATSGLSLTASSEKYRIVATRLGEGKSLGLVDGGTGDDVASLTSEVGANGAYSLPGLIPGIPYTATLEKQVTAASGLVSWDQISTIPMGDGSTFHATDDLTIDISSDGVAQVSAVIDPSSKGFTAEALPKIDFTIGGSYVATPKGDVGRGMSAEAIRAHLPASIFISIDGDNRAGVWSSKERYDQCNNEDGALTFSANVGGDTKVALDFTSQETLQDSFEDVYSGLSGIARTRVDEVIQANNPWISSMCDWEPVVENCKLVAEPLMTCQEWGCYVTNYPSAADFDALPALAQEVSVVDKPCRTHLNNWNEVREAELNALQLDWCDWRTGKDLDHTTGLGKEPVAIYADGGEEKKAYLICKTTISYEDKGGLYDTDGSEGGSGPTSFESINRYEKARGTSLAAAVAAVADPQCATVASGPFATKREVERSAYLRLIQEVTQGGPKWGSGGNLALEVGKTNACSRFAFPEDLELTACIDPVYPENADWNTDAGRAAFDEFHKAWTEMPQICHSKWPLQSLGLAVSKTSGKFEVDASGQNYWPYLSENEAGVVCPIYAAANPGFHYNLSNYDYETYQSTLSEGAIQCRAEFVAMSEADQKTALGNLSAASWKTPYEDMLCFTDNATVKSIFADMAGKSCVPDTYQEWKLIDDNNWGEVTSCVGAADGCFDASGNFKGSVPGLIASGQIRYPGGTAFEIFSRSTANFLKYQGANGEGGGTDSTAGGGGFGLADGTDTATSGDSGSGSSTLKCALNTNFLLAGVVNPVSGRIAATYTAIMNQKCTAQGGGDAGGTSTAKASRLNLNTAGTPTATTGTAGGAGQQGGQQGGQQQQADENDWKSKVSFSALLDPSP